MQDATLQALRNCLRLSTPQVAALSGYSVHTVRAIEWGRRREPRDLRERLTRGLIEQVLSLDASGALTRAALAEADQRRQAAEYRAIVRQVGAALPRGDGPVTVASARSPRR